MHAIVFDVDGTLLQSAEVDDTLYRDSVRTVLGDVRLRSSLAEYDHVTDSGILSQILEDNSIPGNPNCIAAVKSTFLEAFQTYFDRNGAFPEIPGAKALVEALRLSHEYSVAIATGGWRETASLKLQTSGFDLTGLPMASSDDSYDRTQIMRIALSRLGNRFESVTYYGDGPWDKAACETLGWRFVAVGPALGGIESYIDIGTA